MRRTQSTPKASSFPLILLVAAVAAVAGGAIVLAVLLFVGLGPVGGIVPPPPVGTAPGGTTAGAGGASPVPVEAPGGKVRGEVGTAGSGGALPGPVASGGASPGEGGTGIVAPSPPESAERTRGADAEVNRLRTLAAEPPPGQPFITPAGRSPIPEPGETLKKPLPYVRLIPEAERKISSDPPPGPIAWTQAHQYVGHRVTVTGTILVTNNIGKLCFLNFTKDWRGKFYCVIFDEAFDALPEPPETYFLNKPVRVTGEVTLHRGSPQIEIHEASQIEIVE